uniref:Uncharacterized protein n=1 Tax=viral metagenome TaxID=1070528 RepID=A0A6M3L8S9_9ZZZZ
MTDGEWFAPREIRFNRRTTIWLLENLETLQSGIWPPEASNYIDTNIRKKGVSRRAPSATPIEYAAEIEQRLERAGLDGLILEAIECWDRTAESLSKQLNMAEWTISKRRKRALRFVSGWRRKGSYKIWQSGRNKSIEC